MLITGQGGCPQTSQQPGPSPWSTDFEAVSHLALEPFILRKGEIELWLYRDWRPGSLVVSLTPGTYWVLWAGCWHRGPGVGCSSTVQPDTGGGGSQGQV